MFDAFMMFLYRYFILCVLDWHLCSVKLFRLIEAKS